MAEQNAKPLFRESAWNRISNVDDLDTFLKVTNPSAWIAIAAFLALIVGLIIWSVVAVVPVTTTTTAVTDGSAAATCWVDAEMAQKLSAPGSQVSVAGKDATSVKVGTRPMSSGEIRDLIGGGYLAEELELADWNYQVDLAFADDLYGPADGVVPGEDGLMLAPADVVVSHEHPITLVFGT